MSLLIACSTTDTLDGGTDEGTDTSPVTSGQSGTSAASSDSAGDPTAPPNGTTSDDSGETNADSDESAGGTDDCTDCSGGMEPSGQACDVIAQNCDEGEKCTPYALDGGPFWDATKCVPVWPEPAGPGETCQVSDTPTSGIDNCDASSMCYGADADTLTGTCIEFCSGEAYPYECSDPLAQCHWANDGVLAVCLRQCDPMEQDCHDGQGCYPMEDDFECGYDDSNAQDPVGKTCYEHQECPEGMFCAPGKHVPACDGDHCCAEYCELGAETNDCWGAENGVICVPLSQVLEGAVDEDIGACFEP